MQANTRQYFSRARDSAILTTSSFEKEDGRTLLPKAEGGASPARRRSAYDVEDAEARRSGRSDY